LQLPHKAGWCLHFCCLIVLAA